ncbi:unnamed protein product, partial [Mesorhabditis belari]|uniref:Uncharacterized protein n=1 Tax=Mesorhabditis belari TaxID=2138241 RepID=A0AAF3J560_9BILA
MSLSSLTPRLVSRAYLQRILIIRQASGKHGLAYKPAAKQLTVNQTGFFKYERDVSRDKRYANPQKLGDTPMRFLFRRLGHAYEIYPFFVLTGIWVVVFGYVVYYSFGKIEIWLDRSRETAPWDWERIRNNYWKKPTVIFDHEGITHRRLEIMEQLQDEMVEAAKSRGTR